MPANDTLCGRTRENYQGSNFYRFRLRNPKSGFILKEGYFDHGMVSKRIFNLSCVYEGSHEQHGNEYEV